MNNTMTNAVYVKKITEMTSKRSNKWNLISTEGFKFSFFSVQTKDLKVGDTVFIAKLTQTLRSEPFVWTIHQIKLPVCKYYFKLYQKEVHEKKKKFLEKKLIDHPQTYFGRNTYIVENYSKNKNL